MLCGHETDDLPIHFEDITPVKLKTASDQPPKIGQPSPTDSRSSLSWSDAGNNGSGMVTGTGDMVGSQSSSSSSGSRPTFTLNGSTETITQSLTASGQGEKKEDRQSVLEKKYKVEAVKLPQPQTSSLQPPPPLSSHLVPMYPDGRYQDNSVPFPRTCGATFSSNDFLVVFNVPSSVKKMHEENGVTPRSLSDLVRLTSGSLWKRPSHPPPGMFSSLFGSPQPPAPSDGVSISDFFTEKHSNKSRKYSKHQSHSHGHGRSWDGSEGKRDRDREMADRAKRRQHKVARIQVYNISGISPINVNLARQYRLDLLDTKGCCEHNAKVASKFGRKDLVQLWSVISLMLEAVQQTAMEPESQPWAMHAFGRPLVEKYLQHYMQHHDVQTVAMIVCMFWDGDTRPTEQIMPRLPQTTSSFHRSPSKISIEATNGVICPVEILPSSADSGWEMLMNKGKRSRSFSESFEDFNNIGEKEVTDVEDRETVIDRLGDNEKLIHRNNSKMLNPDKKSQYEQIKRSYADILYKWGLLNQRVQVLKHTVSVQRDKKIEFSIPCSNCNDNVFNVQCNRCQYPSLNCSICHIGVKGPANMCLSCGHGGHSSHMMEWFHSYKHCPTGCGCDCLQEMVL